MSEWVEFLTVDEIAERWRVSRMTIYRMVESNELPHLKIGRSIRIRKDVVEWYENRPNGVGL